MEIPEFRSSENSRKDLGMDAGLILPPCKLRLIGADSAHPLLQAAIEELWRLKHDGMEVHRHSSPPSEMDEAEEVWVMAEAKAIAALRSRMKSHSFQPACLFLCGRSSPEPLPDLRHFAAADWIFHPWAAGELELRIRALLARAQAPQPVPDHAFFQVGSESARFPLKRAKADAVSAFERGYLVSLMQTHAGNVSAAARAARKHRRAFLALLRKHRIDADGFRKAESPAAKPRLILAKHRVRRIEMAEV